MKYSQTSDIARQWWVEIPGQFGYASLDEYIVLLNHIHGIIQINNKRKYFTGNLRNRNNDE